MATEVNERTIWQVSAGPADRSYADRFLEHGVALIGPGDTGPWRPDGLTRNSKVGSFGVSPPSFVSGTYC